MMVSDYLGRASLSPESHHQTRPRKVKMPLIFNPEYLFTARSSKNILTRIKCNLAKLCDVDNLFRPEVELLNWKSKFSAEIMDLCRIEIV